jgi:hypothetical protein
VPSSRNLGTLTSWNPLGHSRPVTGLLYLLHMYPTCHCSWVGTKPAYKKRQTLHVHCKYLHTYCQSNHRSSLIQPTNSMVQRSKQPCNWSVNSHAVWNWMVLDCISTGLWFVPKLCRTIEATSSHRISLTSVLRAVFSDLCLGLPNGLFRFPHQHHVYIFLIIIHTTCSIPPIHLISIIIFNEDS